MIGIWLEIYTQSKKNKNFLCVLLLPHSCAVLAFFCSCSHLYDLTLNNLSSSKLFHKHNQTWFTLLSRNKKFLPFGFHSLSADLICGILQLFLSVLIVALHSIKCFFFHTQKRETTLKAH